MKYTIRDIAKLSGFSVKTVSRVINNEANVSPETKRKILNVIAQTNYKPNLYARNLNSKTTKNILISIRKNRGQNTTRWFDTLMSYIMAEASKKKYTIIQEIIYDDSDLDNSILETSSGYIDVVVLFYLEAGDKRLQIVRNNRIPHIAFEKNNNVPVSVSNNNRKGVLDAAKFLFARNLTNICLLLGAKVNVNIERADAMIEAFRLHGHPLDQLEIVYNMNNLETIKRFVDEKIESSRLPQVFFVSGDEKAIAVYHSVYAHGLSIPDDVSVIGFDNISISPSYSPPLTTVGQNFEKLAEEMFAVIGQILEGEKPYDEIESVEVDPQLIIRQSVK